MNKFNIISKYPSGMVFNKTYDIEYQINNKPEIHKLKMICISIDRTKKMVFLGENELEPKEKDKFLDELKEFQKGASYRRNHPIALSHKQKIQKKIDELQKELDDIKKKENDKIVEQFEEKCNISNNELLEEFVNSLAQILTNPRYRLDEHNFNGITRKVVYDKLLKVPVKVTFLGRLNEYRDLTYDEKLYVMNILKNREQRK